MATLYVDHFSQPCRSVMLLSRMQGLKVREEVTSVSKGATRTPEFLAMAPLGRVPFFKEDNGFGLAESSAILRHMCTTTHLGQTPDIDHWYPAGTTESAIQARATIDSVMSWHASTLRIGTLVTVFNLCFAQNCKEKVVEEYGLPTLKQSLEHLNNVWLANSDFVAGPTITIADLMVVEEVEQLIFLDRVERAPCMAELLSPHPKITAWLDRVRSYCEPHYSEVHEMLRSATSARGSKI